MSVIWYVLAGLGTVLALAGYVWYSLRRATSAESASVGFEEDGKTKQAKIDALEARAQADEVAKRIEAANVKKDVVERADAARARKLLRDAWGKNRNP